MSESGSFRERTQETPALAAQHLRRVSRCDVGRCLCAVCACVYFCVYVYVCVRATGWLQGSRGLPERSGDPRPRCPRHPPRQLLTWKLRFRLVQRERRIDTADGAGAAASRPPRNVCVCARGCLLSPSRERKYSTEAQGAREEARQTQGEIGACGA